MSYEPTSTLAKTILASARFTAFSRGFLDAQVIADQEGVPVREIEGCLAEFVGEGLIEELPERADKVITYKTTMEGWKARERLLRTQGLRHPALAAQQDFELGDLVIALVKAGHIFNERTTSAGFLGSSTERTVEYLSLYLGDYAPERIAETCERMVGDRLLVRRTGRPETAYDLWILGTKLYDDEVRNRLHLGAGETILDEALKTAIEVFYAWQSEFKPARNMIGDVLPKVLEELNQLPGIVRPLKLVMATEAGDGAVRIDQQLLDRARHAAFFVGDVTPVFSYERRLRANDNVLVEVGYALASKPPEQIILVSMKRDELAEGNPQFAFDIAMVRRHQFDGKDALRTRLMTELKAALQKRGWLHD